MKTIKVPLYACSTPQSPRARNLSCFRQLQLMLALLLAAASLLPPTSSAQQCVPVNSDGTRMAAWWPGEGNAGDAFLANNGTLGSGVGFASGEVGQAFNFTPGHSGVKIPANSSLHVGQLDNYNDVYFGIEAWIKPVDISTPQPIIQWNDGSGLALWISVNSPGSLYVTFGQGQLSLSSPAGLIDTNSFHHVAVTYGGFVGSAHCVLYVDGVLVATNNGYGQQATTSGEVTLGFSPPSSRFTGLIDEVGVYNYLVPYDPSYIQSIYNAGSVGRCRPLPNIVTPPNDQAVLAGTNGTFTVGVASSPFPWGYQWQFNGTNLPSANNSQLILTNVQPTNAGIYTVAVTNYFGSVTSAPAYLTVITSPVTITSQPASQTATVGNDLTFTVVAGGSGPYSYQWLFQGTNIAGATGSSYTVNAQLATSGTYDVLVSNPASSILSSNATLALQPAICYPPPSGLLAWWPADGHARDIIGGNDGGLRGVVGFGTGKVGQDFSFTSSGYVSVSDGANWSFGTNDFSIELWAGFNSTQADNFFVGHDEGGSGGSNRWSFGLNNGSLQFQIGTASGSVQISSSPFTPAVGRFYHLAVTQTGGNYTFFVNGSAMGSATNSMPVPIAHAPLSFGQSGGNGYLNGQLDEIAIYNRALSATEVLGIFTASSAGKCESASLPLITSQPADQTVTAGARVTLSAQIASLQPLACQWLFNSNPVTGATNLSLTLYTVSASQAGLYQIVASNSLGTVASRLAQLTVLPNTNTNNGQPIIVVQPQSRMYMACDPAVLTVAATGNGPLSYQWYLNGTLLTGSNFPTLSIPGVTPTSAGTYQVVVNNSLGSVASSNAVVSLVPNSLLYFNNFNTNNGNVVLYNASIGTDNQAPTPPNVANLGQYGLCLVANSSAGGTLNNGLDTRNGGTVGFWMMIGVFGGPEAELSLLCGTNYQNPPYQSAATDMADFLFTGYHQPPSPYAGWTFVSADIPIAGKSAGHTWFEWAMNQPRLSYLYGPGEIDDVTISTFLPPWILTPLQDQTALTGQTVAFNAVAVGDHSMTYQWQFNGTNLAGATQSTLTLANVTTNQSGAYRVQVGNSLGSLLSLAATLTVNPSPLMIDFQPQAQAVGYGSNVTLTVLAEGAGPLSYQWQFNGANLSGATNSSLTLANFQLSEIGGYQVIISNSFGSITSAIATINPSSNSYALGISVSGSTLTLSWPTAASGFVLEFAANLTPPIAWSTVTNTPATNGQNNVLLLPTTNGAAYYRLHHP